MKHLLKLKNQTFEDYMLNMEHVTPLVAYSDMNKDVDFLSPQTIKCKFEATDENILCVPHCRNIKKLTIDGETIFDKTQWKEYTIQIANGMEYEIILRQLIEITHANRKIHISSNLEQLKYIYCLSYWIDNYNVINIDSYEAMEVESLLEQGLVSMIDDTTVDVTKLYHSAKYDSNIFVLASTSEMSSTLDEQTITYERLIVPEEGKKVIVTKPGDTMQWVSMSNGLYTYKSPNPINLETASFAMRLEVDENIYYYECMLFLDMVEGGMANIIDDYTINLDFSTFDMSEMVGITMACNIIDGSFINDEILEEGITLDQLDANIIETIFEYEQSYQPKEISFQTNGEHDVEMELINVYYLPSFEKSCIKSFDKLNVIKYILQDTFMRCSSLISITIPDSVTSIGRRAFYNCSRLTSVTIPDSVTTIEDMAFNDCYGLISVTIPDSVTSIGSQAFYNCSRLTSIVIPDSVTSIGSNAFSDCYGLTSVTISDSVTSIGSNAFYRCSGLTSIVIPDSVTSIGERAFNKCSSLTSITIPDSVTSIGSSAFASCSGLTSIEIPDSVTSIDYGIFQYCSSLTSITIPDSVTSIGSSAFASCSGLTSIVIPNSVTTINSSAFYGCSGLTSIVIPNSVTSIGSSAFYYCSRLTSITIPDSVTEINGEVFRECSRLASIVIPDSVTSIGGRAFEGCSSLTSVTIPDSVTELGSSAFYGCSRLTSVDIGSGITTIGSDVFYKCTSLTSITIRVITPPSIDKYTFRNLKPNGVLYVPQESIGLYDSWMSNSSYYLGYSAWTKESIQS